MKVFINIEDFLKTIVLCQSPVFALSDFTVEFLVFFERSWRGKPHQAKPIPICILLPSPFVVSLNSLEALLFPLAAALRLRYVLRITCKVLFSLKDFAGGETALNSALNPLVMRKRLSEGLRARLRTEALRNLLVWLRPYGCDRYYVLPISSLSPHRG
jgi:hypothetical protein